MLKTRLSWFEAFEKQLLSMLHDFTKTMAIWGITCKCVQHHSWSDRKACNRFNRATVVGLENSHTRCLPRHYFKLVLHKRCGSVWIPCEQLDLWRQIWFYKPVFKPYKQAACMRHSDIIHAAYFQTLLTTFEHRLFLAIRCGLRPLQTGFHCGWLLPLLAWRMYVLSVACWLMHALALQGCWGTWLLHV